MSESTGLFLLFCIIGLLGIVLYQRFAYRRETVTKLLEISRKLSDILEKDSAEQVMIFTDDRALTEVCGQINRLLLDRQKIKTEYKRQQISSKKMLSNISHDIKTPLTVILGYLELMRLEDAGNENLQKVEAKAKQVMELINAFFTLAKLEAGDMNFNLQCINANEICRENILSFYDILQQKDFVVDIHIPEQTIAVQGDKEALGRICANLISNAVRYGSEGSYIGLTLRESNEFAFIDVTDRGKGIEKAFAESVFERLFTMEDSRSRNIHGNGLGLTIAKNLAVQMGGDILLESEPNVETTFTVQLKKWCVNLQ